MWESQRWIRAGYLIKITHWSIIRKQARDGEVSLVPFRYGRWRALWGCVWGGGTDPRITRIAKRAHKPTAFYSWAITLIVVDS